MRPRRRHRALTENTIHLVETQLPQRHRPTAEEVRRKYGTAAIFLVIWEIWCVRDGWFHANYEYVGFSRFLAWICAPILAFCIIMAASASRALRRQRSEGKPPVDPIE